jgi:lipopolysaccharide transport system ATP-binding protein
VPDIVIRAEGLGKRYRIGERERYLALRDVLARALSAPARLFQARKPASPNGDPAHIWALKDVSFEVRQGEVVGIIGRNGAGKTTLLKILARVTRPTEGRAQVKGRVGSLLEVGTGFHPELTGRENVLLSGAILGMSKAEILRKFDEIVAFAEVERFIDTPLKHYSSGMQMRLAFAVAAHLQPEILLVDEVLAVGDFAFQRKCLGKMGQVARQGRTVLFVSHQLSAVRSLCSRGLLLSEGRNVFEGSADQVIERYLQESLIKGSGGTLHAAMHQINTGELFVRDIVITNGKGQALTELRMAESFTVAIRFEIRKPTPPLRVGIGFNTLDGVRIATLHHTDGGQDSFKGLPGLYEISIRLTNPLLPGSYVVSVGAHTALGATPLDYVPDALRFNVLDIATGDRTFQRYNNGLVHFEALWSSPRPAQESNAWDTIK